MTVNNQNNLINKGKWDVDELIVIHNCNCVQASNDRKYSL